MFVICFEVWFAFYSYIIVGKFVKSLSLNKGATIKIRTAMGLIMLSYISGEIFSKYYFPVRHVTLLHYEFNINIFRY